MAKSSKSSSVKSTKVNKMSKVRGPFEKYNLFEKMNISDNCWDVDGVKISGPGPICWIYIFYLIIINIISLFAIENYKQLGFTNVQILIRYLFQFLFMFLSATFMYSMCKRCRGLEGFLILALLGFVAGIIALGPFFTQTVSEIQKLKNNNIVEGTCADAGQKCVEGYSNNSNKSCSGK